MSHGPDREETRGPRTHCIRCGACCLTTSPTLQRADLPLVTEGLVQLTHLYTLRAGEVVRDNLKGELTVLSQEMLKVREKETGGGCIFYDDEARACTIYDRRPIQCVALACWDTREFLRVYNRPKAVRLDIIEDRVLAGLIESHEVRCSYARVEDLVRRIETEGEAAIQPLLELLRFDFSLRPFVCQKLGLEIGDTDFLFGRPLLETMPMFGLKVVQEPGGAFVLTPVQTP